MRRRWKLLVVLGAVALLASLLFLLPPRDDGLNWVRKYHAKEHRDLDVERSFAVGNPGRKIHSLSFEFEKIPEAIIQEIRNRSPDLTLDDKGGLLYARLSDGRIIIVERHRQRITVERASDLNWFERQWAGFKRIVGLS
jgi:hypothetical protein